MQKKNACGEKNTLRKTADAPSTNGLCLVPTAWSASLELLCRLLGSDELIRQHHPHPPQGCWHMLPSRGHHGWQCQLWACQSPVCQGGAASAAGAEFSSTFKVLGSSLCEPGRRNATHTEVRTASHSYWHGHPLLLKAKSRQRCSSWNFGRHMDFLTRAAIVTVLKSVLRGEFNKNGKRLKTKKSFQSLKEHKIWKHLQQMYRNTLISKLYTLNPWNGCQPWTMWVT